MIAIGAGLIDEFHIFQGPIYPEYAQSASLLTLGSSSAQSLPTPLIRYTFSESTGATAFSSGSITGDAKANGAYWVLSSGTSSCIAAVVSYPGILFCPSVK